MKENQVYLYVFVRIDMASMNPGKAAAQACHAANQCVYKINKSRNQEHHKLLKEWEGQSGFGTTLVFGGYVDEIIDVVETATSYDQPAGIVIDPSYPIQDGITTHHINIETAGYVLSRKDYKVFNKDNAMNLMP